MIERLLSLCFQDAEAVERLNESGELRSILKPFKVKPKDLCFINPFSYSERSFRRRQEYPVVRCHRANTHTHTHTR